jgi:hypothetical protein
MPSCLIDNIFYVTAFLFGSCHVSKFNDDQILKSLAVNRKCTADKSQGRGF